MEKRRIRCKGCELVEKGYVFIEEVAHDQGCISYVGTERVSVPKSELRLLCEIALAAERFDKSGCVVNQMNRAQWQAYMELKALFHGGVAVTS